MIFKHITAFLVIFMWVNEANDPFVITLTEAKNDFLEYDVTFDAASDARQLLKFYWEVNGAKDGQIARELTDVTFKRQQGNPSKRWLWTIKVNLQRGYGIPTLTNRQKLKLCYDPGHGNKYTADQAVNIAADGRVEVDGNRNFSGHLRDYVHEKFE